MPDPTFMAAQSQVANPPGQEQVPPAGNMGALGVQGGTEATPQAPTQFGDPSQTMGQVAGIRDAIMGQFPHVTTFDDPNISMTPQEKIGFFALAISNPKAALDVVRQQQERHIQRQKMAADFNSKALGIAGTILGAQHQAEMQLFQMKVQDAQLRQGEERMQIEREQAANTAAYQQAEMQRMSLQNEETKAQMDLAAQQQKNAEAVRGMMFGGGGVTPPFAPGAGPGMPPTPAAPTPTPAQPVPPVIPQSGLGMSTPQGAVPSTAPGQPQPLPSAPTAPGAMVGGGGPRPPRVTTSFGIGASGSPTMSRSVTTGGPDEQMMRDPRFGEFREWVGAVSAAGGGQNILNQYPLDQLWSVFLQLRSGQPGDFGAISPIPGGAGFGGGSTPQLPPGALSQ